jgi:hypothetical protein
MHGPINLEKRKYNKRELPESEYIKCAREQI